MYIPTIAEEYASRSPLKRVAYGFLWCVLPLQWTRIPYFLSLSSTQAFDNNNGENLHTGAVNIPLFSLQLSLRRKPRLFSCEPTNGLALYELHPRAPIPRGPVPLLTSFDRYCCCIYSLGGSCSCPLVTICATMRGRLVGAIYCDWRTMCLGAGICATFHELVPYRIFCQVPFPESIINTADWSRSPT